MIVLPKKLKKASAVLLLSALIYTSCDNEKANNGKADEVPPPLNGESNTEQMPLKKLSPDSSSEMPIMVTPDSTATMPNGYDSPKVPVKPVR